MRMEDTLHLLSQLQNLGAGGLQQLRMMQGLEGDQSDVALKQAETAKANAATVMMRQEAQNYPQEQELNHTLKGAQAVAQLGQGLAFDTTGLSAEMLPQIAQRLKLYTPNPDAALMAKAAQLHMTPDQYRQLLSKLQSHGTSK